MRQPAHKTHRVGEQHGLTTGQRQASRGGVERGKEAILHKYTRCGERIEQCRLASVGVTHDGDRRQPTTVSALTLLEARTTKVLQLTFQFGDALHDATTVYFELCFTRATRTNTATLLAECSRNSSSQTRQAVTRHCQLHLRLTFKRVRVLSKNIENDCSAIECSTTQQLFQVVLLCWRQLVIKHHGVGIDL